MGDLKKRIKETSIRKVITEYLGIKGTVSSAHTAQSEEVIVIVRKEDMSSIAPSDTRCRADVKGKRCSKETTFSLTEKSWSQMCEKHHEQNEKARMNKASKVVKFVESEA